MARWKLLQPHYLKAPGTKWEYIENTRAGRPVRKQYDVPRYLHPEDPGDWTVITDRDMGGKPVAGDIIICLDGKGLPGDITVEFNIPTPDMFPLDEEAQALSDKLKIKPNFAEEAPEGGYAGTILQTLGSQLAEAMATMGSSGPSSQKMESLMEQMSKTMEQNAAILALLTQHLVEKPAATARRI